MPKKPTAQRMRAMRTAQADAPKPSQKSVQSGTTRMGGRGAVRHKDLQERAFYMSVAGYTVREIGAELGIDKSTAAKYVRDETALRQEADNEARESDKARRVARLQYLSRLSEESRNTPGSGALAACARFEEMVNKILGVDAPTKIDVGLDTLLGSLNARDDEPA